MYAKGRNLTMQYEIPKRFKDRAYILDLIKSLDEGRDFINQDTFEVIHPGIHTFKLDYGHLFVRNIKKPLIEMWRFHWK